MFPRRRQHDHKYAASHGSNGKFYNAIRKYGWNSFDYEVLYTTFEKDIDLRQDILNEKEVYYISKFDSFENGYNMTPCGENYSGENHPSYGTHLSEEHKEKLKDAVRREVSLYTKEGDYVLTFKSAADAARYFNKDCASTILKVCKGLGLSALGYLWKFGHSKDNIGKFYKFKDYRPIYLYTLDGKLVRIWRNAMEAHNEEGYSSGNIYDVCNHRKKLYGKKGQEKFLWSYSELNLESNLDSVPD